MHLDPWHQLANKNRKKIAVSQEPLTDSMKFGIMMHNDLFKPHGLEKKSTFKKPRWRTATILKKKNRYSLF